MSVQQPKKRLVSLRMEQFFNLLIGSQTNHPWDNKCKNLVNEDGKPLLQPVFVYQRLGLNNPQYTIIIPETVDVGTDFKITAKIHLK